MTTALAADITPAPVTVEQLLAIVDELAVASAEIPRSPIVRMPLITELRAAVRPDTGGTGSGRSSGNRAPLDLGAFTLWEDITGRIESLHEAVYGDRPAKGSHEQILIAWSRELVATAEAGTGLSQDYLRYTIARLRQIRDLIADHFDPPRTGHIRETACYACGATHVLVDRDGETQQMPALGWSQRGSTGLTVTCRACDASWDKDYLAAREQILWAQRLTRLDQPLTAEEWARLRQQLQDRPPLTVHLWRTAS